MKKRLLLMLIVCLMTMSLFSCQSTSEAFEDVKAEFSQFSSANDVALVLDDHVLFFNDHTLNLEDLFVGREVRFFSVNLLNEAVYYVVSEKIEDQTSVFLYRCNMDGSSPEKLFEQAGVTSIKVDSSDEAVSIQYKKDGILITNRYQYLTRECLTLNGEEQDTAESVSLRSYSVKKNSKSFTVIGQASQEQHVIDEEFLKQTPYMEALKTFRYRPFAYSLEADRVFLVYRLKIEKPFEVFPDGYAMAIFEYDFESKQLDFKSCIFPYDCEGYDIEYALTIQ